MEIENPIKDINLSYLNKKCPHKNAGNILSTFIRYLSSLINTPLCQSWQIVKAYFDCKDMDLKNTKQVLIALFSRLYCININMKDF